MEHNGNQPQQPQQQVNELDPNIKAIFDDIEKKLGQVNMMLVLQFSSSIALNCIAQLPGIKKDIMSIVSAPIVAAFNSALQFSEEHKKQVNAGLIGETGVAGERGPVGPRGEPAPEGGPEGVPAGGVVTRNFPH